MYYIYHIPSEKKIGVTENPERRLTQHILKYGVSANEFSIMETHTDIYEVSDRERELQRSHGYPVDKDPYWYMRLVLQPLSHSKEARKKAVQSIDFKAKHLNTDYKARTANTDYKLIAKKNKIAMEHVAVTVRAITKEGNVIGVYSSQHEAARALKMHQGSISGSIALQKKGMPGYRTSKKLGIKVRFETVTD